MMRLLGIFKATERLDVPTIYPVHPRNKQRAIRLFENHKYTKLILTDPVGYLESACLVKNAKKSSLIQAGCSGKLFCRQKMCNDT